METQKDLIEEYDAVINDPSLPEIAEDRKGLVAKILHNQAQWNDQNKHVIRGLTEAAPENYAGDIAGSGSSNIAGFDPVLINMLRRATPQMIAFDVCGVQPLKQPTGLIFAIKARYGDGDTNLNDDPEALFDEAVTNFSGKGSHTGDDPSVLALTTPGTYETGVGLTTQEGESLGDGSQNWGTMGMTIESVQVGTTTRGLRADYTHEIQHDLRQVHGLDAEKELANILSTEILSEINREVIRDLYTIAELGALDTTTAGTFDLDTDSNGRWSVEKFKGLIFQMEREANQIAIATRRGKGNVILCSQDVASAMHLTGLLDHNPALKALTNLNVDASSQTFVGILNGRTKVYVDPYLSPNGANFCVVGYKGATQYDAGYFYSPYVPLEMYRAMGEETFQPRIAFKSRYGKVTNPFANRNEALAGQVSANQNKYYRKFRIENIM